jgi:hypothetical protein
VRIGVVKRGCLAPQTWLLKMFKTLTAFPEGKHDDQVVALGLVGQLMDKYVPGHVPKKEPENEKWPHAMVAIGCDARKGYETFRRSALADIPQCNGDVRFGSKADICTAIGHVRFTPNSDIDCVLRHVRFAPKAER